MTTLTSRVSAADGTLAGAMLQVAAPAAAAAHAVSPVGAPSASTGRGVEFFVDSSTGKTVINVIDSATGAVVRQIPGEVVLRIARYLDIALGGRGGITDCPGINY